jgi:diguanylate cyclase (GGDEF)-like protein
LQAGAPTTDELLDQAGRLFMSAPQQAQALAEQAWAALPEKPAGGLSALHARVLRTLGLALHYGGRHAEGLLALNRALAATPADDAALLSKVLRGLSIGAELLGAPDDALAWARRALEAARTLALPRLTGDALLSVGVACSTCGDPATGLDYFAQVLALCEADGDDEACINVLNNMGINCKNLQRHAESVAHFERALLLAEQLAQPGLAAVLRSNMGEPLMLMGRLDEASAVLLAAIAHLAAAGFREGETHAHVAHGRVLLARGESDAAQTALERALALTELTGGRNHAAAAHLALAGLHKAAGRFSPALHHHEAYHAAERAQFNADSDRKVASLRVRMEVADARHDAELHRLRHVEIARAHDELKVLHAALLAADEEKTQLVLRLAEQSHTDALTGLANRRWLDEHLRVELARARRHGTPLAVALCDLDFFKRVNDHFGHTVGDEVLRRVASILRERCRSTDLVARYGGEEFCIAFLETDAAQAARTCEALRHAVASHDWGSVHRGLAVTLSIGVSDDAALATTEPLLADADKHLYQAKHEGKNRVCWTARA